MPQTKKNARNQAIRDAYQKWDSKKYTLEYRLQKVADQFYLQPNTVYLIVMKLGPYRD